MPVNEDAYDAFAAGYEAQRSEWRSGRLGAPQRPSTLCRDGGAKNPHDAIEELMPLLVHVRDAMSLRGGNVAAWDKDWRLAQLGWWHDSIDHLAAWGTAHRVVTIEGKGKLLWLQQIEPDTFDKPVDLLNAFEMFVKMAALLERFPVLPEIPCELTLDHDWPDDCTRDARWHIISANESATAPQFRCSINGRETTCKGNCLNSRWLAADLEPYFTSGATFRSRFPAAPVKVDASMLAGKNVTAAQLKAAFEASLEERQLEVSVAHLPRGLTDLSGERDQRNLWSCASYKVAEALAECTAYGLNSTDEQSPKQCRELDDPDSSLRKSFNSSIRVEQIVWKEYDLAFKQKKKGK
ncbi:hypothetical protein CYMTET_32955 [Cymbomonas tetramitiformis]|uniref:Uncharacterized protein n=1 Tax=Cymbomonas tetramitiformis TaxID=36881 RepID=A0AAE0FDT0_9CHLO|nr:hypothetical protein CYMTET_32955 [Cymbomonas tetramitiformis]